MRKAIHLVQRGVTPLKCIACGAVSPVVTLKDIHRAPAVCFNERDWHSVYANHKDYRRCTDPFDPPTPFFPEPEEEGYYWAEWRHSEKKTNPTEDLTPCFVPEVVEVVRVIGTRKDRFKVFLFGVSTAQSTDCFIWRSGKLDRPQAIVGMSTMKDEQATVEGSTITAE